MTARRFGILACSIGLIGLWLSGPPGRLVVTSGLLLYAPGYLLERALPIPFDDPFLRPALWLGLSISITALVYQWVTACGLALTHAALATAALVLSLIVFVVLWRSQPASRIYAPVWSALLAVFTATLALRLYQIRDLVLPAWVDSVHHALLIRVAIERGQAPINLYPYLPITKLPYHWGYHVVAAASAQLASITVPQVMLWQGQALNALHVLTGAALASYIWRKPWAGVIAGVVVGLVSIMPAFYVSWGRYTQLTGLLLLPPLAIAWQGLLASEGRKNSEFRIQNSELATPDNGRLEESRVRLQGSGEKETRRQGDKERVRRPSSFMLHPSSFIHSAVLLAGLNLVHFRVLLLGLCLLAVQTLVWMVTQRHTTARRGLVTGSAAGLGGVLLTAPWLVLLAQQRLVPAVEQPQSLASGGSYVALSPGLLWAGENRLLVALALFGGLLGLRRGNRDVLVMVMWVAGLVVMANPQLALYILPVAAVPLGLWALQHSRPWLALFALPLLLANPLLLRLPSSWLVTNDVVAISLFVPLAVLIGGLFVSAERLIKVQRLRVWQQRTVATASAAGLIAIALWGAWSQRDILNTTTVFANNADLAAIEWAAQHTPADARFLIGATGWLPTAERGTDGGWWLLPLTGRWTSTPPVLFDYASPDYVESIRERTRQIAALKPSEQQEVEGIIARDQITFVYLREGVGPLTRAAFSDPQRYTPIYERDGVTILAVAART